MYLMRASKCLKNFRKPTVFGLVLLYVDQQDPVQQIIMDNKEVNGTKDI